MVVVTNSCCFLYENIISMFLLELHRELGWFLVLLFAVTEDANIVVSFLVITGGNRVSHFQEAWYCIRKNHQTSVQGNAHLEHTHFLSLDKVLVSQVRHFVFFLQNRKSKSETFTIYGYIVHLWAKSENNRFLLIFILSYLYNITW